MPFRNTEGEEVKRIWFSLKFPKVATLLVKFFLKKTVKPADLDSLAASFEDRRLGNLDQSFAMLGYDLERIATKKFWNDLVVSSNSETVTDLRNLIVRRGEKLSSNYQSAMNLIEASGLSENFTEDVENLPIVRYGRSGVNREEFLSSREQEKAAYPEGIEAYLLKVIESGDAVESRRIIDRYFYGDSSDVKPASYPIGLKTHIKDFMVGTADCVFAGHEFSYRASYAETWGTPRVIDPDVLLRSQTSVMPGDVNFIKNTFEKSSPISEKEGAIMAIHTMAEQTMAFKEFLTFFQKYTKTVFDSRESAESYFSKCNIQPFGSSFEEIFDLEKMKESERTRVKRLWEEGHLVPPFFSEINVKTSLKLN